MDSIHQFVVELRSRWLASLARSRASGEGLTGQLQMDGVYDWLDDQLGSLDAVALPRDDSATAQYYGVLDHTGTRLMHLHNVLIGNNLVNPPLLSPKRELIEAIQRAEIPDSEIVPVHVIHPVRRISQVDEEEFFTEDFDSTLCMTRDEFTGAVSELRDRLQDLTPHPTKAITLVTVTDPDSNAPVELEIRKDLVTGAMVGIDASFLANTDEPVYDPYNLGHVLDIPDDEEDYVSKAANE